MAREKKEPTREERLRKEERRIAKVLKNIPVGKRAAVEKLIREMAYMGQMIADAKRDIDEIGLIEEYKNGENQFGRKKNPAVEIYDKTVNTYAKVARQLTDLLPDGDAAKAAGAALKAFLEGS